MIVCILMNIQVRSLGFDKTLKWYEHLWIHWCTKFRCILVLLKELLCCVTLCSFTQNILTEIQFVWAVWVLAKILIWPASEEIRKTRIIKMRRGRVWNSLCKVLRSTGTYYIEGTLREALTYLIKKTVHFCGGFEWLSEGWPSTGWVRAPKRLWT